MSDATEVKRKPGRPRIEGGIRRTVTLDAATMERAKALGGGNLSAGIRAALATTQEPAKEQEPI